MLVNMWILPRNMWRLVKKNGLIAEETQRDQPRKAHQQDFRDSLTKEWRFNDIHQQALELNLCVLFFKNLQ